MQRLERLVGPPRHALPVAGGRGANELPARPTLPPVRVAVPQSGMASPFAALAGIALPSQQQQQQVQSPFAAAAQAAASPSALPPQQQAMPSPFTPQAAAALANQQQQQDE